MRTLISTMRVWVDVQQSETGKTVTSTRVLRTTLVSVVQSLVVLRWLPPPDTTFAL